MILLNEEEIPAIEDILIKYKKSLHKEWALRKSEANIDFRNFAAHELRDLIAKAQLKRVVGQLQVIGDVMPKGVRGNEGHLYVFPLAYYKALLEEAE